MHGGDIVIAGAAETSGLGELPTTPMLDLHAEAALLALADAGVSPGDVDGLATAGPLSLEVSHHLGIRPRWSDSTMIGGCSFLAHVRHASAAIAAGAADIVLITHGESGRSWVGMKPWVANPASHTGQFESTYGAMAPYSALTIPAMAFLDERGMRQRDLAEVVVAQREWAMINPRAMRRKATTVEEVLAAPVVAYPFTKDMCCLVADGGGALVLMSRERAADLPRPERVVYVLGSGESLEGPLVSQIERLGSSAAIVDSSREAFRTAGLAPVDVDHFMMYDAFAHLPLYGLEDVGFVGFGESGGFVADGQTRMGGGLPMNTNGGGLSYAHTGMYGMFAIQEAVRQLRGEAAAQVPGLRTSFVQGVGFYFGAAASLVLANERP